MKMVGILGTLLLLAGIFIISLPDKGPRVVTFSNAHGPGLMDLIGILLAICGLILISYPVWKQRRSILSYKGSAFFSLTLIVIGVSYGLIVSSVFSDFYYWWLVGIFIQLFILFLLFFYCIRIKGK